MIPSSFRGHDVITALVTLASVALPDTQILDGPRRNDNIDKALVLIGYDPLTGASVVASRGESELTGRNVEDGIVALFLSAIRGDGDMAATRAQVVGMLEDLEAALRESDLDGSCDEAQIGPDIALTEQQSKAGAQAHISASIQYRAYI